MNMENENKLRNMLKELIRLNIKLNYAALAVNIDAIIELLRQDTMKKKIKKIELK